jgi:hypothetical protein
MLLTDLARASRTEEEEKPESRKGEKTETSETADLIRNEIPDDDPFKEIDGAAPRGLTGLGRTHQAARSAPP